MMLLLFLTTLLFCLHINKALIVFLHRGEAREHPENTLASFDAAFKHSSIEFDVRVTSDHHYVIIHNFKLEMTSNGSGLVKNQSLEYIRSLDAGSWKSPRYKFERIPTFLEVVNASRRAHVAPIMIEIKEVFDCNRVLNFIHQNLAPREFLLFTKHMCFDEINARFPARFITRTPNCESSESTLVQPHEIRSLRDCWLEHKNGINGLNILKVNAKYFNPAVLPIAKELNISLILNLVGVMEGTAELKAIAPFIEEFPFICSDVQLSKLLFSV